MCVTAWRLARHSPRNGSVRSWLPQRRREPDTAARQGTPGDADRRRGEPRGAGRRRVRRPRRNCAACTGIQRIPHSFRHHSARPRPSVRTVRRHFPGIVDDLTAAPSTSDNVARRSDPDDLRVLVDRLRRENHDLRAQLDLAYTQIQYPALFNEKLRLHSALAVLGIPPGRGAALTVTGLLRLGVSRVGVVFRPSGDGVFRRFSVSRVRRGARIVPRWEVRRT